MFSGVIEKYVDSLAMNGKCKIEDKELIIYGIHSMIEYTFNIFSTVVLGFLFGLVVESLVFLASFSFIRTYAGGYHARTALRCYFISIGIVFFVLLALRAGIINNVFSFLLVALATPIVLTLSPIQDINKPLDKSEIKVYRKRSYILLAINILIFLLSHILGFYFISHTISIAMFVLSIALILGKIKNITYHNYENFENDA